MQVNESNLTGEPVINKTIIEADFDEEATYASNLVMRGTTVVDGHGTMRVLHVGDATEIGKVARQSTEENLEPTPLNIQLTKLANLIGKIGFTVACVNEFANRHKLSAKEAFQYLFQFKGIAFIKENYDVEHTLDFDTILDDLRILCKKNGGTL